MGMTDQRPRSTNQPNSPAAGGADRQLFEFIEEGFFSAEVLRDNAGVVRDWRYI
jgi:hypothetical protein